MKHFNQYKISRDVNGNKILKMIPPKYSGRRGFSIQTNGNLPTWHKVSIGTMFTARSGQHPMSLKLAVELLDFLKNYGTNYQKSFLLTK